MLLNADDGTDVPNRLELQRCDLTLRKVTVPPLRENQRHEQASTHPHQRRSPRLET